MWLMWLRDGDLHDPARNTVFLASERDRKQQLCEAHGWDFEPITIGEHCHGMPPNQSGNRRVFDRTGHDGE